MMPLFRGVNVSFCGVRAAVCRIRRDVVEAGGRTTHHEWKKRKCEPKTFKYPSRPPSEGGEGGGGTGTFCSIMLFLAFTVDANDDVYLFGCIKEDGGAEAVKGFSGRRLPSGHIECLGRKDNQIKRNGYRVGLGEVQQALLNAPRVKDAVVVVSDSSINSQLVGFVVLTTPEVDCQLPLQVCPKEKLTEKPYTLHGAEVHHPTPRNA